MVDIGDVVPVFEYISDKGLTVEGVFLTHAHFDHIYGLEALVERYPNCKVFATEYAKKAMSSDKLNLSRYHGARINYDKNNVVAVHEGESMTLFEGESPIEFFETPGHNPGCLTMVISNNIFTGDAYIPEVDVNTSLPHSNKERARVSLLRITRLAEGKRILSGHYVK